MSLAPRSSLRSLVLLMSHGKPRLSSFFSSSYSASGAVTLGTATPVAPAVQPPALPECSSHKSPDHQELVLHPLPGGPCGADDKPSLYASSEDPKYPIPDDGSCSTLEPASGYVLPDPRHGNLDDGKDPNHDQPPPPPHKLGTTAIDETSPPYLENLEKPVPDGGSYSSTDAPVPSPHKPPPTKTSNDEHVPHGLRDPPRRSSPV